MKQPEAKQGDVLVFTADNKWISKLIAWGTFSDVSHAAMVYDDGQMVEMGPDGIMLTRTQAGSGPSAERAHLLRLSPEQDSAMLIGAAQKYLQAKICYDFPALVLLGAVLIYRRLQPDPRTFSPLDQLLAMACVAVDQLIKQLRRHPDAMVCSQLVYQVYQDCGAEYQLTVENGLFEAADDALPRLFELARPDDDFETTCVNPDADPEALCRELFLTLAEPSDAAAFENIQFPHTLTARAGRLHSLFEQLAELAQVPLEALLVMPSDLAYHTTNLEPLGTLVLERCGRIQ